MDYSVQTRTGNRSEDAKYPDLENLMNRLAEVDISLESPLQRDVREMIGALDAYLAGLYPSSSNHLSSVESLASENVRFLVARLAGKAVGCGALVLDRRGYGEIKRMYVDPEHRGLGMGRAILRQLEQLALGESCDCVRLETGVDQPAALTLYRDAGYSESPPFGDYGPDPLSVFMEKTVQETPREPGQTGNSS